MNTRLVAAQVINAVTDGTSLSEVMPKELETVPDPRDRALIQAMVYGVCRFYDRLDMVLSYLLENPMKEKDSDVHALLLVGLYQLMEMRVPEHAAVSETVNASVKLNKSWARGLINAVLREYIRNKEHIENEIQNNEEAFYSHPVWWMFKIKKFWPDNWKEILLANNEHPPFSLRVNLQKHSREEYMQLLQDEVTAIAETKSGIILKDPVAVESLPGFASGDVSVQDGAAQLAAELLQFSGKEHVLDACAAPGGKLTHIFECQPDVTVVAVEKDAQRIKQIEENLARQNITNVELKRADAANIAKWWDGKPFDRILLDAPCSASGVIRRHPDIKILRQPTDIKRLTQEQYTLLEALWTTLAPNGLLLYATCSIFPEENNDVVRKFLASHADAKEEQVIAEWGIKCDIGRQILPGMHNMDGFYFALLRKV